jgi:hypothetical protein
MLWLMLAFAVCASSVGSIGAWIGVEASGTKIALAATDLTASASALLKEAQELRARNQTLMTFTTLVVKSGPGEDATTIATYADVTDFTEHSNYVSFRYGPNHIYKTVPTDGVWITGTP